MTPYEKAKELIEKYIPLIEHQDHYWGADENAKECALLCAKTIQSQAIEWGIVSVKSFWIEVIKEIESY